MPLVRNYPAPLALLVGTVAALAAAFLLTLPQYRPHEGTTVTGTAFPAASSGWRWQHGLPGGDVGGAAADVMLEDVSAPELEPARAATARAGIDAASVRPLRVARYGPGAEGLAAILAGSRPDGRTCLGFVVPPARVSFVCPGRQRAFAVVTALPATGAASPLHVLGIVGGDVERVAAPQPVYRRNDGWWGTFLVSTEGRQGWKTQLVLSGKHGRTVTDVGLDAPGSRLVAIR